VEKNGREFDAKELLRKLEAEHAAQKQVGKVNLFLVSA